MKKTIYLLLVFSLVIASFLFPVSAAYLPVEASVEFVVNGNSPSEVCTFRLEAVTHDSPLPETTTGNVTKSFGSISYFSPGIHEYRLSQVRGSNTKCIYDDTVYLVTVVVANDKDGNLVVSYVIEKEGDDTAKFDVALFTNSYPDEPKTGDEMGAHRRKMTILAASAAVAVALCVTFLVINGKSDSKK